MSAWGRFRAASTRPSATAILHGVGAVLVGVALLVEPPGGYQFPVFDGPRRILGWTGEPFAAWGVVFLVCGVSVLALRAGPASRWLLAVLAGAWGVYGGSALYQGLTNPQAASIGGLAWLIIAAGAVRGSLEFQRPRGDHGELACPLAEDCLRLPASATTRG